MWPLDEDADFEAELHASRPRPREEFKAHLDAQAADGFPRWPRLLSALRSAVGYANACLAPILAWISRRSMHAIEAAGWMQRITLRSVALWGSVILAGLALGSSLPTIGGAPADREGAYYVPSQAYTIHSAVAVGDARSEQSRFANRRRPPLQQPEVARSTWLRVEPTADGIDATVVEIAEIARACGGTVERSAVHDGGGSAWGVVQLGIPDVSLGEALPLLSDVGEVRSRFESTLSIAGRELRLERQIREAVTAVDSLRERLAGGGGNPPVAAAAELRSQQRYLAAMKRELASLHRRSRISRVLVWIGSPAWASGAHRGGIWAVLDDAPRMLGGVGAIGLGYLVRFALAWMLARPSGRRLSRTPRRRVPANVR
jgi:hypothetical protein